MISKAANTTADVVGYRYGESVGDVVANSAETVTNSVRAVSFVSSMRKVSTHAESVAKNNGKAELTKSKSSSEMECN